MLFPSQTQKRRTLYLLAILGACITLLLSTSASAAGYTLTIPGGSSKVYVFLNGLTPAEVVIPGFTPIRMDLGISVIGQRSQGQAGSLRYRLVIPADLFELIQKVWLTPIENPIPPEDKVAEEPVSPSGDIQGLTAEERQMFEMVNKERMAAGVDPLKVDMRLVELARKKSRDMIDRGYFDHVSPTYGSPFDMMRNAGIHYRTAGENLAGAPTVERAHIALMNSPGHRRNILNPAFTHVGIGVVKGGPYGMMFTQMFIGVK